MVSYSRNSWHTGAGSGEAPLREPAAHSLTEYVGIEVRRCPVGLGGASMGWTGGWSGQSAAFEVGGGHSCTYTYKRGAYHC